MTDFNPYDRDPQDFLYPEPTFIERAKAAAASVLAQAEPRLLAVDLSHWNGNVDFAALRGSGVQAVILKCSEAAEGTYYEYKDTKFEENWRGAVDEGFPTMVYHFFRDNKGSAEKSWFMKCADAFLQHVDGKTACWLDVEWRNNAVSTTARANRVFGFCDLIKGEGIRQGVYSSPGLVAELFPPVEPRWGNVYQWDAHWTNLPQPTLPRGWSWDMMKAWQFGISPTHGWTPPISGAGTVDVNWLYFASEEELRIWLGEQTVPPPTDCCDELRARIEVLEAGQQVLTEIQQIQNQRLDQQRNNIDQNKADIVQINHNISQLFGRVIDLETILNKIHNAFH